MTTSSPRSDAYTGLLFASFLALAASCALFPGLYTARTPPTLASVRDR